MRMIKRLKKANSPAKMKRLMNWYGPYFGAGIRVDHIADNWQSVTVSMKQHWYNSNAVGTHFGGSLYAMVDPHYMLMLMRILGPQYIVWDKAATIDFVSPGRGKVSATMTISDAEIERIKQATATGNKDLPVYCLTITDEQGEAVAVVDKTLYIRKKTDG
jgi:acyl-coenzyme A thioesterase PaaI-like protein